MSRSPARGSCQLDPDRCFDPSCHARPNDPHRRRPSSGAITRARTRQSHPPTHSSRPLQQSEIPSATNPNGGTDAARPSHLCCRLDPGGARLVRRHLLDVREPLEFVRPCAIAPRTVPLPRKNPSSPAFTPVPSTVHSLFTPRPYLRSGKTNVPPCQSSAQERGPARGLAFADKEDGRGTDATSDPGSRCGVGSDRSFGCRSCRRPPA